MKLANFPQKWFEKCPKKGHNIETTSFVTKMYPKNEKNDAILKNLAKIRSKKGDLKNEDSVQGLG